MGVKGDLLWCLVAKGKSREEAIDLTKAILDGADDPNFAMRFAAEYGDGSEIGNNKAMCDYWDVIKFLKWTIE